MADLVLILLQIAGIVLVAWRVWWTSQDAEQRGKAGWLVALLALITWPVGILFWLVARPAVWQNGPERFPISSDCQKCGLTIPAGRREFPNCGLQLVDVS
ncbi:MAG: hypothetical protein IPL39_16590 [Opitutaceae bacterium]|nr:hypothetical protein [Opitutaceae bacterium]